MRRCLNASFSPFSSFSRALFSLLIKPFVLFSLYIVLFVDFLNGGLNLSFFFPFLFQISSLLFFSVLSSASRLFYHTFRLECRFSYAPPSPFFVAYYHSLCFRHQATFFHSISHQTKPTQPNPTNKQTKKLS